MNKSLAKTNASYEKLIERLVKWAENRPDIRVLMIVGSRARMDHPADKWSDLDVIVVATDPRRYLSTTEWLENLGKPLLTFLEPTVGGQMERRVLFEGMLDVDFSIIPREVILRLLQGEIPPQILEIFKRGVHVLLDKDGITSQLYRRFSSVELPPPHPPTEREFLEVVYDFLYHAVWTLKKILRGELWTAKFCLDSYMKRKCMLRMIEWHAHVKRGWAYDTWFDGRFLEEWADSDVIKELRKTFSYYDEADIKRGLLATMNLFRKISMEIAEKLNYSYPIELDKKITEWIRSFCTTS